MSDLTRTDYVWRRYGRIGVPECRAGRVAEVEPLLGRLARSIRTSGKVDAHDVAQRLVADAFHLPESFSRRVRFFFIAYSALVTKLRRLIVGVVIGGLSINGSQVRGDDRGANKSASS
jgi:hypothetical protein